MHFFIIVTMALICLYLYYYKNCMVPVFLSAYQQITQKQLKQLLADTPRTNISLWFIHHFKI